MNFEAAIRSNRMRNFDADNCNEIETTLSQHHAYLNANAEEREEPAAQQFAGTFTSGRNRLMTARQSEHGEHTSTSGRSLHGGF